MPAIRIGIVMIEDLKAQAGPGGTKSQRPTSAPGERPQAAAGGGGSDAPPSNTASNNSIPPPEDLFAPLRWGVDSLYLSYRGSLHPEREDQLV